MSREDDPNATPTPGAPTAGSGDQGDAPPPPDDAVDEDAPVDEGAPVDEVEVPRPLGVNETEEIEEIVVAPEVEASPAAEALDPDEVPTLVERAVVGPMDRARAALRASREARGLDPDEEDEVSPSITYDPRDPYARAEGALQRAAEARAEAAHGRAALEREARAREELARLKSGERAPAAGSPSEPRDENAPKEEKKGPVPPRRRRL